MKPSTRITTPKNIYLTGPPDPVAIDPENQVKMSISFLCNDLIQNQIEGSALSLLSYLLCDTATSPLYKALLESGVAPSYSPANGFEMHYKEGLFNLGVSGNFYSSFNRKRIGFQIKNENIFKLFPKRYLKEQR